MVGDIELDRLHKEDRTAVARRIALNGTGSGNPMNAGDAHALRKAEKAHHKQLRALRAAVHKGKPQAVTAAKKRLTTDFSSKLMAVVRATAKTKKVISFATLEGWANSLALDHCYHEAVIVRPRPHGQSWRPICTTGVRRRAQQLMVRDLLLVQVGDNPYDSTVSGAGGEAQLFSDIKQAISEGVRYWASLDVRSYFPSLRPGHLAGFPLSEWMVRNIVFLPPETPIRFIDQRVGIDLGEEAIMMGGEDDDQPVCPSYTWGLLRSKVKQVRQGLPQGDVCAPQIGRMVLGRELQRVLDKNGDVVYGSHLDDVIIGARSRSALKASIKALTYRLNSHPAGPLDLQHSAICDAHESAYFLGYRFSVKKEGTVYVRPALDRFDRFRERLRDRLENSTATTKDGFVKIAFDYSRQWFRSHPAWDQAITPGASVAGPSWDHVWSEALCCINQLIHDEWLEGSLPWTEADIDFDLLAA